MIKMPIIQFDFNDKKDFYCEECDIYLTQLEMTDHIEETYDSFLNESHKIRSVTAYE